MITPAKLKIAPAGVVLEACSAKFKASMTIFNAAKALGRCFRQRALRFMSSESTPREKTQ